MFRGPVRFKGNRALALILTLIMLISIYVVVFPSQGFKQVGDSQTIGGIWDRLDNITSIGDLDRDGYIDLVMTLPDDSTYGENAGIVHLFWGGADGFPDLRPSNADVTFHGYEGFRLGSSVETWDLQGNGWEEIVIGCPGANESTGRVLIYSQVTVNGAGSGMVYSPDWAYLELSGSGTHSFGGWMCRGNFTDSGFKDLVVLSSGNSTVEPQAHFFMGGGVPGVGVNMTLPPLSVSDQTRCTSTDIMGRGREAFIFSTPERAMLRIVYFNILETVFNLPGSNSSGIQDFQGSIPSTGDTYGWGAGDDGWDTSGSHIFDTGTGPDSLRFNQASGNARGYNRSVERVNRLDIEMGGIFSSSSGSPESGAYGLGFQLSPSDLKDKNSAVLSFDYTWEDWGFEESERMWIKGRLTNGSGYDFWLGSDLDFNPDPDETPEIWTIKGVNNNGNGIFLSGEDHFEEEIIQYLGPPGEHYLELGGKISRWTNQVECGAVGFDNISLTLREVEMDLTTMTGSNGLGSLLNSEDLNGDGSRDLITGNFKQDRVRIFFGNDTYWDSLPGFNEDKANITINGITGSHFGRDIIVVGPSPFTPMRGLFISMPAWETGNGSGALVRYDLPMEEGSYQHEDGFMVSHGEGEFAFGLKMIAFGDPDEDEYPDFLVCHLDGEKRLVIKRFNRGPNYPDLRLNSPQRGVPLSGTIEIKATMSDPDLDATPWDIRFYRSIDNRSWSPVGNGTPDKVEGQSASKYWNTTNFENRLYFIKVEITDSFGLTTARFSNSIQILNHRPPTVFLTSPSDGAELSGDQEITARVQPPSEEELSMPVSFLYSRDGENWTEFSNRSSPDQGSDVDYSVIFDTEKLDDGPIWFKANATTEYGLGSEDLNSIPCNIDNDYSPVVDFIGNYSGNLSGNVNITVEVTDKDGDLLAPVQFYFREPGTIAWNLIGNMSGPLENSTYFYLWDTESVDNGVYHLMVKARDYTFNDLEEVLNHPVQIHNLYQPSLSFVNVDEDSVLSGIERLRIRITDRDMNFERSNLKVFFRDPEVGIWNRISPVLVTGENATVDWDTNQLKNKEYDLRAEITDNDNLSAAVEILGVTVKNIMPPKVQGELFPSSGSISGVKRLIFNVTDDEPVPIENIKVEVFVFSTWEEIGPVKYLDPGAPFLSGKNVTFYVDWDTTEEDEFGISRFPDGPGYEFRITITDSDGETGEWRSVVSYRVSNEESNEEEESEGEESFMDPGIIASLVLVAIVLIVVLIIAIFIWRGSRSEKKGSIPDIEHVKPRREMEAKAEETTTGKDEREDDIYSPPGWGDKEEVPATQPAPDYSMADASLFMGGGTGEEMVAKPRADIFDEFFGEEEKPTPKKKKAKEDISVDIDLPEGAMPSAVGEEAEDWEDAEEWDEEEEDWEEFEEMEDLEDLEEDDWEDEEVLVVTCKCGEEIEIPSSGDGRFSCPECGRTGRVRI